MESIFVHVRFANGESRTLSVPAGAARLAFLAECEFGIPVAAQHWFRGAAPLPKNASLGAGDVLHLIIKPVAGRHVFIGIHYREIAPSPLEELMIRANAAEETCLRCIERFPDQLVRPFAVETLAEIKCWRAIEALAAATADKTTAAAIFKKAAADAPPCVRESVIRLLLGKKFAPPGKALVAAARNGDAASLALLFRKPQLKDSVEALWVAVRGRNVECVALLIDRGVQPKVGCKAHRETFEHVARNDAALTMRLIRAGADPRESEFLKQLLRHKEATHELIDVAAAGVAAAQERIAQAETEDRLARAKQSAACPRAPPRV